MYIMSLYRPPDGSIDTFFDVMADVMDRNLLSQKELWILGDYNIDFLKRTDNRTKRLIDFLRTDNLKQCITEPTRLAAFSRSCTDLIISNISENCIMLCGTLVDVISDHLPVFVCIKKKHNIIEFHKIKGRSYRKYDKTVLQTIISNAD